jgi:adenylate kinase family enzyme
MDQGDLVPDDVTIKMLQAEVDNNRFSRIFV